MIHGSRLFLAWLLTSLIVGAQATPSHPCPITADMWLLAGQSNMAGFAPLDQQAPDDARIQMFNLDNTWINAQEPLHRVFIAVAPVYHALMMQTGFYTEEQLLANRHSPTPVGGVGPGLFFARHILQATGQPIALIPCALGATSISQWDPALRDQGDDSLYGAMLNRVMMTGGPIKGMLWYQGESDADSGQWNVYGTRLLAFIDAVRQDTGNPDMPFIFVQLGRVVRAPRLNDSGFEQMREIQRGAASQRTNVFMVSGIDGGLSDNVHLNFPGQQQLGRRMAEVALTRVYGQSGHGDEIEVEYVRATAVESTSPRLEVKFRGVSGGLQSAAVASAFALRPLRYCDPVPSITLAELDPQKPDAILLNCSGPLNYPARLIYGLGEDPAGIAMKDARGMLVPLFGPIPIHTPNETSKMAVDLSGFAIE